MTSGEPVIETERYQLTFEEYSAGYRPLVSKTIRNTLPRVALIWAGVLGVYVWLFGWRFLTSHWIWGILGVMGVGIATIPRRFTAQFRKAYDGQFGSEFIAARFDGDGVTLETDTLRAFYRWSGLTHFKATDDRVVLYRTERMPMTIPRRAFADEAAFRTVVAMVERRIGYASQERGFAVMPVAELAEEPTA